MRRPARALLLVTLLVPPPLVAQLADVKSTEMPPILPRAQEVALARSAAPAEISLEATVLVLVRGTGYEVAAEGTNGVTCLVSRTWPESIEPHCFDREGSRTILPVHVRQAELRELGWSKEAIEQDVADGFRTGLFTPPRRPAMSWMMSAGQVLVNDAGRVVGAWKPHLMIYYPYMTEADLGITGDPPEDGPMLDDPGRPTSNVIVIMPSFVQPGVGGDR
jgi:hypothetical protein